MRTIAIDALGISQHGGGRSATLNVLEQLLRQDTASRYLVYLDQREPTLDAGAHVEQRIAPTRHRLLVRAWAEATWPFAFRRERVDLVHHVKNLAITFPGCRTVVTIYDLTTVIHPEMFTLVDRLYWRKALPWLLRRSEGVIAISNTTSDDLQRLFGLDPSMISVIYPAYNPRFREQSIEERDRVRRQYGTGERFVLHVGTISLKKNLLVLLKAFEQVRASQPDLRLVLVGRSYNRAQDRALYAHLDASPHRDAVVFTGPVPDEDLPALYAAATVFVFPSLHEGFGIVPLEAMACGAPVITSAGGALPEVAGGGGTIVADVARPEPLAKAIERIVADPKHRDKMITRGLSWAKRYSAAAAAQQTLALYDEVLGDR